MKSRRVQIALAFFFGLIPLVSSFLMKAQITFNVLTLPFVMGMLLFSFERRLDGKSKNAYVAFLLAFLVYALSSLLAASIGHKAKIGYSLIYAIVQSIPLFAFIGAFSATKGKKRPSFIIVLVISIALYGALDQYCRSYIYLFYPSTSENTVSLLMKTGYVALSLGMLSKSLFDAEKNYFNHITLLLSSVLFGLSNAVSITLDYQWREILLGITLSPLFFLTLLDLLIYIKGEKSEKRKSERRNIIFSGIVYQEVKPIKRKAKKQVFEIPPNLPKFKGKFTTEKESDEINTMHNV